MLPRVLKFVVDIYVLDLSSVSLYAISYFHPWEYNIFSQLHLLNSLDLLCTDMPPLSIYQIIETHKSLLSAPSYLINQFEVQCQCLYCNNILIPGVSNKLCKLLGNPLLIFSKSVLDIIGPTHLHTILQQSLGNFIKFLENIAGTYMGIILNSQINLGRNDIIEILSTPSIKLYTSPFIQVFNVSFENRLFCHFTFSNIFTYAVFLAVSYGPHVI